MAEAIIYKDKITPSIMRHSYPETSKPTSVNDTAKCLDEVSVVTRYDISKGVVRSLLDLGSKGDIVIRAGHVGIGINEHAWLAEYDLPIYIISMESVDSDE